MLGTCPQALRFHIKETRARDGLCNKVSVCNNDLLHAPIATQIAFCSGLHHNRPRDVKCYIGVGWIRLEAGGCFVAARFFYLVRLVGLESRGDRWFSTGTESGPHVRQSTRST